LPQVCGSDETVGRATNHEEIMELVDFYSPATSEYFFDRHPRNGGFATLNLNGIETRDYDRIRVIWLEKPFR
jgi:hypothetical protein